MRDSTKIKRAKKEEAAIASLNKIEEAMARAWPDPKSGDLTPHLLDAAKANADSARILMRWFIEAVVKGETPSPLLQGYFASCFEKILGGVDLRRALNLRYEKMATAARNASIESGVNHLIDFRGLTPKQAMLKMAEVYELGDGQAGLDRVKNIITKNKKSSSIGVKN